MLKSIVVLFAVSYVIASTDKGESYQGYKTFMVFPKTDADVGALQGIGGLDFWSPLAVQQPVTVMVQPESEHEFINTLRKRDISHKEIISNVEGAIDKEKQLQREQNVLISRRSFGGEAYLSKYLRYNEIVTLLKSLAKKYSNITKLESTGTSFEGRPTYILKVSTDFNAEKPVVVIESGSHAREWAGPALALHSIHQVLRHPQLLEKQDWFFIPMLNPDGYEYTHTKDRLWRKTRSKTPGKRCKGVDPNRNYKIHWSEIGSSYDSCQETYHGPRPFSEQEVRNAKNAIYPYRNRFKSFISLHSFGGYILYPMGHTRNLIPDWKKLENCGQKANEAIVENGGESCIVGNSATVLYPAGAGADDYMKGKLNAEYAYTIELPGGGFHGFDLPPTEIEKTVTSFFPGVLTLAQCWQDD